MKKLIGFLAFMLSALFCFSQAGEVPIRADSVVIYKKGGNADLIIKNSTRDTAGFAVNVGAGKIAFKSPFRINDSTLQIGPITIIIGVGTSHGDTIYIAPAVDTFYTTPIGTGSPMIQTLYAISGTNFSNLRHSNWGPGIFIYPTLASDSLGMQNLDTAAVSAWLISTYGLGTGATSLRFGYSGEDVLATANRNFNADAFTLEIDGSGAGSTVNITNSTYNALLVSASGSAAAAAISALGSGIGLVVNSSSDLAGHFIMDNANNSSVFTAVNVSRTTTTTATNGIGVALELSTENDGGGLISAATFQASLTDVTSGSETSSLLITGSNAGVTSNLVAFHGDGSIRDYGYGTGTITGTPTYFAAWDASGNLIETAGGGSANHLAAQTMNRGISPSSSATVADFLWANTITNQPFKIETTGYWIAGAGSTNYVLTGSLGGSCLMIGWTMTINSGVQQEGTFKVVLTFNPQSVTNSYGSIETIWTLENAVTFLNEVQQDLIDASNYITCADLGQHQQSVITTPAGLTLFNCSTIVTLADPSL